MCLAILHIPLREFYDYTPIEITYAFDAYYENKLEDIKVSWEQTRMQIYFSYLYVPSKKRKVSYESFKKEFLPLSFDDDVKEKENQIDDEAFATIMTMFENIQGVKN
jgi:hypothetical protein